MDNQKKFKEIMESITGKAMGKTMKESKEILQENCSKLTEVLMPRFSVDIKDGNEPLPFCYSGIDKPAKLVWVGLNPGAPLKRPGKWNWDEAGWKDIIDYCVPNEDIRNKSGKSTYDAFLSENKKELEVDYYRFVLRMHMALFDDEVCDTWRDVQNKCKENKKNGCIKETTTADLFLERFAEKPVLTAELIPYKSKGIQFSADSLMNHKK